MVYARLPEAMWKLALLILAFSSEGSAWDYSSNGANWATEGQCGAGGPQSPINLPATAGIEEDLKLFLKYPKLDSSFQLYHNGNSIAFTVPESYKGGFGLGEELDAMGSKDASAYRLWQVNFHSPSEHTLKGERMPLEMQMMHQRVTGGKPEVAVVVVLFANAANAYLDFLDKLTIGGVPKKPWDEKTIPKGIEFPIGGSPFYHYSGSLTSPPCERKVKYYVRQDPILAAHSQLRLFAKVLKDTCAPGGNFRAVQPLSGSLNLFASVDAVKSPDVTVKPKVSQIESEAAAGPVVATFKHCPPDFVDNKWKNVYRIQVGDSREYIDAKTTYNRKNREKQVADGNEGNAVRGYKFQKGLYDNAPGLAEKIKLKWGLVAAEGVLAGAKKALASFSGAAAKNQATMEEAILAQCRIVWERNQTKLAELGLPPVEKPPPAEITKPVYPEPHVKLPCGLAASPFGSGDEGGGSGASKVASNLQQEDLPPSSSTTEAEGKKEIKPEKKEANPEIIIRMDLPISPASIVDQVAFKNELVAAIAASAELAPDRLQVKTLKGHAVASVHASGASLSLAQKTLRGSHVRKHG